MKHLTPFFAAAAVLLLALVACSTSPQTVQQKPNIEKQADAALARVRATDPSMGMALRDVAGYAVFPSVGKGAAGVGGAYGKGVLYDGGVAVGYCDLSQATDGLQLGGRKYTEIIALETPRAVEKFKKGNVRFDAQDTAVALKSGAGANANFTNEVAVFTMDEAGPMFRAPLDGQKFTYQPM